MEWEGKKLLMHSLNDFECNTEVVYREHLVKRENDKLAANSREAAAKELPPDQQVARAERQARAMPTNLDVAPLSSQADLYPKLNPRVATNLDHIEYPGRRQAEISRWRRSWTLNPCSTHCLSWVPNQANCWVPSPVPHQTPLQGRQDLRQCRT